MTATPSYDETVQNADREVASFQLAGWVGAVVIRDGLYWTAVRRTGGDETVASAEDVRTAVRHYTSALHQAATQSLRSPV